MVLATTVHPQRMPKSAIFTWTLWGQSPVLQGKYMIPMRCEKRCFAWISWKSPVVKPWAFSGRISWEGVEWWATGEKKEYIYICIWLRFPNSHVMGGPMIRPANNPFPTSFKQTCPTIAIKSPELKTFQVSVRWNLFKPQEAFLQALNQPTNKNILGHLTNQPQKKVMNFWGGELN